MDIAKYIGLYLLKNNYCTIPGLCQLRVVKGAAQYKDEQLTAGNYNVELSSVGAIDDSLPNFVASAEQVSISKSSNEISTFVATTKASLKEGKEVIIPAVGKFTLLNGSLHFITDPNLQYTPPALPVIKVAEQKQQEKSGYEPLNPSDYTQQNSGSSFNWGKLLLTLLALTVVLGGGIFAYKYLNEKQATPPMQDTVATAPAPLPITDTPITDTAVIDTAMQPTNVPNTDTNLTSSNPTPTTVSTSGEVKQVILNSYTTQAAADKRANRLKSYGNNVSVVAKDSTWHVVMPANVNDTKLMDSLRRMYNPKDGVKVLQ